MERLDNIVVPHEVFKGGRSEEFGRCARYFWIQSIKVRPSTCSALSAAYSRTLSNFCRIDVAMVSVKEQQSVLSEVTKTGLPSHLKKIDPNVCAGAGVVDSFNGRETVFEMFDRTQASQSARMLWYP